MNNNYIIISHYTFKNLKLKTKDHSNHRDLSEKDSFNRHNISQPQNLTSIHKNLSRKLDPGITIYHSI